MSKFTRHRAKARQEKIDRFKRIDQFYETCINFLSKCIDYAPLEDTDKTCSLCKNWEPGDSWSCGQSGIEAEGVCSKCKLPCWNYRNACKKFDKKKMTGFFYQGGDLPLEEDLKNVETLTNELLEDNGVKINN